MKCKLYEFEAIGAIHSSKLERVGIIAMDDLLRDCSDLKSRKKVARMTGIRESLIFGWANLADLMRITGAASDYARLLKASDVGTIAELSRQTPEQLLLTLSEVNSLRNLCNDIPSITQLTDWIAHANAIEPFVNP